MTVKGSPTCLSLRRRPSPRLASTIGPRRRCYQACLHSIRHVLPANLAEALFPLVSRLWKALLSSNNSPWIQYPFRAEAWMEGLCSLGSCRPLSLARSDRSRSRSYAGRTYVAHCLQRKPGQEWKIALTCQRPQVLLVGLSRLCLVLSEWSTAQLPGEHDISTRLPGLAMHGALATS